MSKRSSTDTIIQALRVIAADMECGTIDQHVSPLVLLEASERLEELTASLQKAGAHHDLLARLESAEVTLAAVRDATDPSVPGHTSIEWLFQTVTAALTRYQETRNEV